MRTATAIVLAAALLAGCGAKAPNKANLYIVAVDRDQQAFARAFRAATASLATPRSGAAEAKALRAGATAIDTESTLLARIRPPAEVATQHARLIAQISAYGVALRRSANLVATGHPQDFLHAKHTLVVASATVQRQFDQFVAEINRRLR